MREGNDVERVDGLATNVMRSASVVCVVAAESQLRILAVATGSEHSE